MWASLVMHRDASVRAVRVAICRHLSRATSQAMRPHALSRGICPCCACGHLSRVLGRVFASVFASVDIAGVQGILMLLVRFLFGQVF